MHMSREGRAPEESVTAIRKALILSTPELAIRLGRVVRNRTEMPITFADK
jgi:hypothetical protein